mgnify:CR=1 FL=1
MRPLFQGSCDAVSGDRRVTDKRRKDRSVKIKTCAETVDIRKGACFVEMRVAGVPFRPMDDVKEEMRRVTLRVKQKGEGLCPWRMLSACA